MAKKSFVAGVIVGWLLHRAVYTLPWLAYAWALLIGWQLHNFLHYMEWVKW